MTTKWLLIETFSGPGTGPTVIGVGNSPRNFVPLRTLIRGRSLSEIQAAIGEVARTGQPLDLVAQGRRVIATPLRTFAGNVHGYWVWSGPAEEAVAGRDAAGAWQFNLSTDRISGSDDLLDLYGVPRGPQRQSERNTAEAFARLVTNADESAALAKLVHATAGAEHQATWTVRRDDQALRAAHFSCRAIAETTAEGTVEVVLRGITEDIGAAESTRAAPPPTVLAAQVLASLAEPGTHRALLNLRTMKLLRWLETDEPMPGVAWEYDPADPVPHWIHPEDLPAAHRMASELTAGRARATLRFRTIDRGWRSVAVTANPVLLDQHTTAALLTLYDTTTSD